MENPPVKFESRAFLFIVTSIALGIVYLTRFPISDDAFISFRYAANLSRGIGLVYNSGEWVLGTTSPLWSGILAAVAAVGLPLEFPSICINLIAAALSILLFIKHSAIPNAGSKFHLICFLVSLLFLPLFHMTLTSGMEAPLYLLCVLIAFEAALAQRWILAGVLAAACVGLRPDGVLAVVVISFWHLVDRRRVPFIFLVVVSVLLLPALAAEYFYYGALLPHSIEAKHLIHPGGIFENTRAIVHRFARNDLDILVVAIGLGGIFLLLRRGIQRRDAMLLSWLACYVLGLICSGVDPIFYWYYYPISFLLVLLGMKGVLLRLHEEAAGNPRFRHAAKAFLLLFTVLVSVYAISFNLRAQGRGAIIEAYARHAPALAAAVKPAQTVYLCETGFLGYHLPSNRIIDSSGINSPEMLDVIRDEQKARPNNWAEWHIEAVRRFNPDWVVSIRSMCSMFLLPTLDWFNERYEQWTDTPAIVDDLRIYKRRAS